MPTPRKTTPKTTTTAEVTQKAKSATTATASPAPLDPVALAQERHADAIRTLKAREGTLAECVEALENLEARRASSDESITARQVRDARDDVEHWEVLVDAAQGAVTRAARALINTSTVLADALSPALEDVLGLSVDATWRKPSETPTDLPATVLVQTKTESADGSGLLSGEVDLYYFRNRLHVIPNAQETGEALAAVGIRARVSDGYLTSEDGVFCHHYRVVVESAAAPVPVIVVATPVSEHSRQYIGYALVDAVEGAYRLDRSALDSIPRPTMGSNGMFEQNVLRGVTVQTGTPSIYSDVTVNGKRTVTVRVNAKCRFPHSPIGGLRENFPALVAKTVGHVVAGAGRISDVRVQSARIPDKVPGLDAEVLVSYVSALPQGQTAPTVAPPAPVQRESDDDYLEPGDEDLTSYLPRRGNSRDVDVHGERVGTHPGVAS